MKIHYIILMLVLTCVLEAKAQQEGSLNSEFSENGWDASIYANNNNLAIRKTIVQQDGKLLVCSEANFPYAASQAVIIRYNSNGTIDTTFGGGDGMVRSADDDAIGLYTNAQSMALQSSGKILVAGDELSNNERIIRLNSDGSFDSSFGTNGVVDIIRQNFEMITHIAVQSDDKIIVCGSERRPVNGVMTESVFLWRFTKDGVLDESFGVAGVVSYNFSAWGATGENYLSIHDLLILPDNKIIINQTFTGMIGSCVLFKKLNANGSTDLNFGNNGHALRNELYEGGTFRYSSSFLQDNGSIVFSFTTFEEAKNYTESVFRLTAEGDFDHSLHIELGLSTNSPNPVQVIVSAQRIYTIQKEIVGTSSFDKIHCYDLFGNTISEFGTNGIAVINQNNIPLSTFGKTAITTDGNIYSVSQIQDPSNFAHKVFLVSQIKGFNPSLIIQKSDATKIIVYPNPTTGLLTISNSENGSIDKIEVVDLHGRIIWVDNSTTGLMDLTVFSSGIYILKVYSAQAVYEKKIIKK